MIVTWPTQRVNDFIETIRGTIGRTIDINTRTAGSGCSLCTLDPTTNLSNDPFCSICSGYYWVNTETVVTISGHVLWGSADAPYLKSGGLQPEGDCKVTIVYTPENELYVKNAKDFTVDGKTLSLKRYQLRGVPSPNRIKIIMVQEGDNG